MNHMCITSFKNSFLYFDIVAANKQLFSYRVNLEDTLSLSLNSLGNLKTPKSVCKDVEILVRKIINFRLVCDSLKASLSGYTKDSRRSAKFYKEDRIFKAFRFKKYRSIEGLVDYANKELEKV